MECMGNVEVQVIRSWRLTWSSIVSELVIQRNSSDCCLEMDFIPMNKWMIGRSLERAFSPPPPPPIEAFYSKLSISGISECDYDHAQRVWREFGMKDLRDCHDLYLKIDALLLSIIFVTILECCVTFSGVKLSIRSFVLFLSDFQDDFRRALHPWSGSLLHLSWTGLESLS